MAWAEQMRMGSKWAGLANTGSTVNCLPTAQRTAPGEYWVRSVEPQAHTAPAEPEAALYQDTQLMNKPIKSEK